MAKLRPLTLLFSVLLLLGANSSSSARAADPVRTVGLSANGTAISMLPGERIVILLPLLDNRAPTVASPPDPTILAAEPAGAVPVSQGSVGRWPLVALSNGTTSFSLLMPSSGEYFTLTVAVGTGRSDLTGSGSAGFDPSLLIAAGILILFLLGGVGVFLLRQTPTPQTPSELTVVEGVPGQVDDPDVLVEDDRKVNRRSGEQLSDRRVGPSQGKSARRPPQ